MIGGQGWCTPHAWFFRSLQIHMIPKMVKNQWRKQGKNTFKSWKSSCLSIFLFSFSQSFSPLRTESRHNVSFIRPWTRSSDDSYKSSSFWIVLEGRHTRSLCLDIQFVQVYFKHHSEAQMMEFRYKTISEFHPTYFVQKSQSWDVLFFGLRKIFLQAGQDFPYFLEWPWVSRKLEARCPVNSLRRPWGAFRMGGTVDDVMSLPTNSFVSKYIYIYIYVCKERFG